MKLKRRFPLQQLLFLPLAFFSLAAVAQDMVTTRDGKTVTTKILGVSGSSLQIQVGAGSVGIPLASISAVKMTPPTEFTAGLAAYEAKDYAAALTGIKAVVDKYKGLPADWAQQATSLLGDIYVAQNDLGNAELAYQDFQKSYPGVGSAQADIGLARIAVSKKDFARARQLVEPILVQALKEKAAPKNLGPAYSQAFYVSGQIKEAGGDYNGALEDYLRTVTLFYQDRLAVNAAQEKADALRREHAAIVP